MEPISQWAYKHGLTKHCVELQPAYPFLIQTPIAFSYKKKKKKVYNNEHVQSMKLGRLK